MADYLMLHYEGSSEYVDKAWDNMQQAVRAVVYVLTVHCAGQRTILK